MERKSQDIHVGKLSTCEGFLWKGWLLWRHRKEMAADWPLCTSCFTRAAGWLRIIQVISMRGSWPIGRPITGS